MIITIEQPDRRDYQWRIAAKVKDTKPTYIIRRQLVRQENAIGQPMPPRVCWSVYRVKPKTDPEEYTLLVTGHPQPVSAPLYEHFAPGNYKDCMDFVIHAVNEARKMIEAIDEVQ